MKPRVAAILSADADGFARLATSGEADAERARAEAGAVLATHVAQRGGQASEPAPGALLAEFASPLDAVLCAIGAQAELARRNAELPPARRLRWRVGVSLGAVEGGGEGPTGAAVDAAAQMEMLAPPGGVCVTHEVWRRIEGRIDARFSEVPAAELAGAPLRAWRSPAPAGANARR